MMFKDNAWKIQDAPAQVLDHLMVMDAIADNDWASFASWMNGRERGYVVSMGSQPMRSGEQLNIAFFEHRNSDRICAIEWIQKTMNPPTIDSAEFTDVYRDKYDVSVSFGPDQQLEMAEWIHGRLKAHWETTHDTNGVPYARIDKIKAGDKVRIDSGFTCAPEGEHLVCDDGDGPYIVCSEGSHVLDGQVERASGIMIGVYHV